MIDTLGFHTDRDLQGELATLQREIDQLTTRVTVGWFHSPEAELNTWADLDNRRQRAAILTRDIAAEDEELERLASAIRTVGDPDLGFIAYVVFGPHALPMQARYEVRIIERCGGYTVPGMVRRNLTASQIQSTGDDLMRQILKRDGHADMWGKNWHAYQVLQTAY